MLHKRVFARLAVAALALVMAGCSSVGTRDTPPAPVVTPPPTTSAPAPVTPPRPPARPPQPSVSSAWLPLVQKAEQATARGDYEQALALLERAHRIDPESGEIYLQLARTHRARGDVAQARATAERGMLFCSSNAQCDALRAFTR
jgi:tetratricopeptide (TPR) repeat protein